MKSIKVLSSNLNANPNFPVPPNSPPIQNPNSKFVAMPPPFKSTDCRKRTKDLEGEESQLLNLWIGDLSPETVDSDLIAIFKNYGALDALTSYSPRTYAFVFFKSTEDAKRARDELSGSVVRGNPIKIEFARSLKQGKSLWIGAISSSVTGEQLEDELLQFGKIEEYRFLRERNSALVSYYMLDDAIAAHKNINGKCFGGEQVRADFQKPQYQKPQHLRRDWPGNQHSRGGWNMGSQQSDWIAPNKIRNFHDSTKQGSKRQRPHGGGRDRPPGNTLWVGYPQSVHMDEQMLHNAMILFGEIENIKSVPSRYCSFVEFRSVDEARRAKEGLQGRLFGDPRIQIRFPFTEPGTGKDGAPLLQGYRGPGPDIPPFGPMDLFGPSHPMPPNSFPGHFLPTAPEPSTSMRPHPTKGFDPPQGDSDFHDFSGANANLFDGNPNATNLRWLSPAPGMHSASLGIRPPLMPKPGMWDYGFDMRESKKSRIDGSPVDDAPFHGRRVGDDGAGGMYGMPHSDREIHGQSHLGPIIRDPSRLRGSPDIDHCWRGVIAKGGLPVCHARCVPLGQGLESPLPEVVNCFARTDLDRLTKHFGEAVGFDIVFFLPDSEEDFASYTEFLKYLGLKNRVGVAKCDDGTKLFLVPPSDFLTKVLKVCGPERLYGVVLKLPHQSTTEVQQPQAALQPLPRYGEQQQEPTLHGGYEHVHANEDPSLKTDYNTSLHETSISRAVIGHTNQPYSMPSSANDHARNSEVTSKVEVSLTPELIATLASLIPSNSQSFTTGSNNMPSSCSFPANVTSGPPAPSLVWNQERQATANATTQLEPTSSMQQQLQQFGGQYGMQSPLMAQHPTYANLQTGPDNSIQSVLGATRAQDNFTLNVQHVSATSTRQLDYHTSSQGQSLVSQTNPLYQHNSSFDAYNTHGMLQSTDVIGMFNQPIQQQPAHASSSAHGQAANMPQNQVSTNPDFSAQMQNLQMALKGSGDGSSNAEKNQRYQSTLQFAASLLQKIQQQQQGSGQAVGESGNQQ